MKPMLAGKVENVDDLRYPLLASPKLDGVRCLIVGGKPMSRNMKPIPNLAVQDILGGLPAMDGELVVGPVGAPDVFNRTQSGVMSREGVPKFMFWVFDALTVAPMPFSERLTLAASYANASGVNVGLVDHRLIHNSEQLIEYEVAQLAAGFEGVMVRDPAGPYKHGRSTAREGWLLKLKRFEDAEAEVVGFVEKETNTNEQTRDELGRAKRSSHKAGKVGANTLGALVVQSSAFEGQFQIGTGFDEAQRADIWARRGSLLGKLVKFKYQAVGIKDVPRFPVWLGFRDEIDA